MIPYLCGGSKEVSHAVLRKRMQTPYLIRLTVLALIMALVGTYAAVRYRIGIDTQQERCLLIPVYLIDPWNKEPVKDGLYAHSKDSLI